VGHAGRDPANEHRVRGCTLDAAWTVLVGQLALHRTFQTHKRELVCTAQQSTCTWQFFLACQGTRPLCIPFLPATTIMAVLSLPLNFNNSFWSVGYRNGLEVLYARLEQVCDRPRAPTHRTKDTQLIRFSFRASPRTMKLSLSLG
jgi:hypothetical protein